MRALLPTRLSLNRRDPCGPLLVCNAPWRKSQAGWPGPTPETLVAGLRRLAREQVRRFRRNGTTPRLGFHQKSPFSRVQAGFPGDATRHDRNASKAARTLPTIRLRLFNVRIDRELSMRRNGTVGKTGRQHHRGDPPGMSDPPPPSPGKQTRRHREFRQHSGKWLQTPSGMSPECCGWLRVKPAKQRCVFRRRHRRRRRRRDGAGAREKPAFPIGNYRELVNLGREVYAAAVE